MVNDPYLAIADKRQPFKNCCGLNATGDNPLSEVVATQVETLKAPVMNMQAWRYAKTILAIVGAVVIVKFIYHKFSKAKT